MTSEIVKCREENISGKYIPIERYWGVWGKMERSGKAELSPRAGKEPACRDAGGVL